ncbi:cytochrome c maturation protein CcmE [Bacillaceae bacterium]
MQTKTKLTIGIGVVLSVLGALIVMGMSDAATFYMTIDEVAQKKDEAIDKPLKMSGKIVGDTVRWDSEKILLTFELEGESGSRIPVKYEGVKPDTLNDGWEAIVEGRMTADGTFEASELLVKCPSKYEAMEESGMQPPAED